jgi:hypothetical protein
MLVWGGVFVVLLVAISVAVASYYMLRSTPVVPVERTAQASAAATTSLPEPDVAVPAQVAGEPQPVEQAPAEDPPIEAAASSTTEAERKPDSVDAVAPAPDQHEPEAKAPEVVAAAKPPQENPHSTPDDAANVAPSDVPSDVPDRSEIPQEPQMADAPSAPVEARTPSVPEPAAGPKAPKAETLRVAQVNRLLAPSPSDTGSVNPARDPAPMATGRRVEVAALDEPATPNAPEPGAGVDLSTLPVLTNSQRDTLGIPELTINFVGMPTKRQPRPSALINLKKVYVGERIPDTNAILIGVEMHGIGIEARGQQFFVPH